MTFREWLALESGKQTRNRATNSNVIDRSVLHGYAAQFGRPDTPGPAKKGLNALVTGIGAGVASGLERRGLVVQPTGDVLGPPGGEEKFGVKHAHLLLQVPVYSHNENDIDDGNSFSLESSGYINKVANKVDPNMVRREYKAGDKINDGKYHPLYRLEDGRYNYDLDRAKRFTRALMIRDMIASQPPHGFSDKERAMYDIYNPEVGAEEVRGRHLVTVFKFKKRKDVPEMLKGEGR